MESTDPSGGRARLRCLTLGMPWCYDSAIRATDSAGLGLHVSLLLNTGGGPEVILVRGSSDSVRVIVGRFISTGRVMDGRLMSTTTDQGLA